MQKLSPGPFTFTYYAEEKNTPATQGEAEQEGPIRTSDFRSETEIWRLMTSIMPSEHQEMMHLQEGVWCQNEHANNAERFIQPEIRATRKMPTQSKTTQLDSTMTSLLRTDGKGDTYMIEEA